MIQGSEKIVFDTDNLTLFVLRNDQCEGVYCLPCDTEYRPLGYFHRPDRSKIELFKNPTDLRLDDETLEEIGKRMVELMRDCFVDGQKSKLSDIQKVLGIRV